MTLVFTINGLCYNCYICNIGVQFNYSVNKKPEVCKLYLLSLDYEVEIVLVNRAVVGDGSKTNTRKTYNIKKLKTFS